MVVSAAESQIATAVKECDDCPEIVKQMLLEGLPNALGPDMHRFQKSVISMLRETLEKARDSAAEALGSANQKAQEAQASLEERQNAATKCKASDEAAQQALAVQAAAIQQARNEVEAEQPLCEKAAAAKTLLETERSRLESAKAEAESIMNGSMRMLLDGGWEDEDVRDTCIDAVCSYLKKEFNDAVLLAALPKALKRKPAEYGKFDRATVDEGLRLLSEKVANASTQLAEGEESFQEARAEHLGAWAMLDMARDRVQAANDAHDAARTAAQSAAVERKLAESSVMEQRVTLADVSKENAPVEAKVQLLEAALAALSQIEAGSDAAK